MSLELEKSMRIINDLVSFCYHEGAEEFEMSVKHYDNQSTEMKVICPIMNMNSTALEEMRRTLKLPRQHEVEQMYWELSGETEFSGELSLVGAMSNATEVSYENNILTIIVHRDD